MSCDGGGDDMNLVVKVSNWTGLLTDLADGGRV
jgi:hypothetical protein